MILKIALVMSLSLVMSIIVLNVQPTPTNEIRCWAGLLLNWFGGGWSLSIAEHG